MTAGMDPVEAHLAEALAAIRPLAPSSLGLEAAEGTVLAEDAVALGALPSFDNSAMDGYAVRASDVSGASSGAPVSLPVTDEIAAGDTRALSVARGTCMRIMTGALMPGGADAVVPVEWTDGGRDRAAFSQPAPVGNAIRHRGDDVAEGAVLLIAGTRLGPAQIGVLAAGGHGSVLARRRPRVAVLATGNELTGPGTPLTPGRIWDSNSYMLAAAVRQAGGVATRYSVTDEPSVVLAEIERLARLSDLLITSGGVSMGGEHDVVKAALSRDPELGEGWLDPNTAVTFRKVAMQPGMPQGFGVVGPDRTPIFTLPGNPVSAFVSFHLFVRPAMDALQGLDPAPGPGARSLPTVRAALTAPVRSPEEKRSYLRGWLDPASGIVTPLTGQGSHQLGVLARANALIVVPEKVVRLEVGDVADVMSLP
ncbi:MAG TPA: gephyrin-like molybdotransferase Glp [Streptosporangiaceae bacterium]